MTVQQLKDWYHLEDQDFWELKRGGRTQTIITHSACEKIANRINVVIDQPQWLSCGQNMLLLQLRQMTISGYLS